MASVVREVQSQTPAPLRPVRLGKLDAVLERRAGGVIYIRAAQELGRYYDTLNQPLEHWAKTAPDRVFLAQRDAQGQWRKLSYAEVLADVKRIGAALLRRGLSAEKPIVVLSGNDIEHALLGLAAMYVGIPYAPISAGLFADVERLRQAAGDRQSADAGSGFRQRRRAVRTGAPRNNPGRASSWW